MKRIDFDLTFDPRPASTRTTACSAFILVTATLLVIVLFASAASAQEFAPCDKVKYGMSGQCYAWKKDC